MTIPLARTVRKLKQAISGRLPKRRDDSGLTTLEWLLIVAAVAGLAALAVVLVQNVVSDTSEQIAGSSARKTAAKIAAQKITADARAVDITVTNPVAAGDTLAVKANNKYKDRCNRLNIVYGDVEGIKVWWLAEEAGTQADLEAIAADTNANTQVLWAADKQGCFIP